MVSTILVPKSQQLHLPYHICLEVEIQTVFLCQVYSENWLLRLVVEHIPASCWSLHQRFHVSSYRNTGVHLHLARTAIPSKANDHHLLPAFWSRVTLPHSTGAWRFDTIWQQLTNILSAALPEMKPVKSVLEMTALWSSKGHQGNQKKEE